MKIQNTIIALVLVLGSCLNSFGQTSQKGLLAKTFHNKVNELYTKYKLDGFVTYKGGDIVMEKNTETPIYLDLQEGRWYQFVVVGDPEARKIEMKLGMQGFGDFITDKFRTEKEGEYWTTFSFICPKSGNYLMTFFQRGPRKELNGHVAVLQRPAKTEQGTYSFR